MSYRKYLMPRDISPSEAFKATEVPNTPLAQPEQRTGKWILDRSGAYCCSECMEPCAGYVMMKPRDKFCKMCGAKMDG